MVDHSLSNVSRQVRGEGGWIYSIGYWRVDRGILEGGGSRGILGGEQFFRSWKSVRKLRKPGVSKV